MLLAIVDNSRSVREDDTSHGEDSRGSRGEQSVSKAAMMINRKVEGNEPVTTATLPASEIVSMLGFDIAKHGVAGEAKRGLHF